MSLTRGLCVTLMAVGLLPPGRSAIAAGSAGTALAVDHLKVEYKTNPLGLDVAVPPLSWQITAPARRDAVGISDSRGDAEADLSRAAGRSGTPDASPPDSPPVSYGGAALRSRHATSGGSASGTSTGVCLECTAWWEMGLLAPVTGRPGGSSRPCRGHPAPAPSPFSAARSP